MAETMGIYGACHMFLYILTLLFKRVYYMNSILRELFLMKTENQIVENGDPRLSYCRKDDKNEGADFKSLKD